MMCGQQEKWLQLLYRLNANEKSSVLFFHYTDPGWVWGDLFFDDKRMIEE